MPTKSQDAPPGATAEDRRFIDRHGSKLSRSTLRARWTHAADDPIREDG